MARSGYGGEPRRAGCRRTPSLPWFGLGGTSRGGPPRAPSGVVARGVTWLNRNGEPPGGRCPASRLEGPTARAEVRSLGQSGRAPLFEGCVLPSAWHRIGAKEPRSGPTFSNRVQMFTGSRCRHAGQRGGWSLIRAQRARARPADERRSHRHAGPGGQRVPPRLKGSPDRPPPRVVSSTLGWRCAPQPPGVPVERRRAHPDGAPPRSPGSRSRPGARITNPTPCVVRAGPDRP